MRLLSPSRTGGKQKKALRLFKQLEFLVVRRALRLPVQVGQANNKKASDALALQFQVRALLRSLGAHTLAREVRVEWNPRLKTCAGRADYREKLISLNPLLLELDSPTDKNFRSPQSAPGNLECKMHSRLTNHREARGGGSELECILHSSSESSAVAISG